MDENELLALWQQGLHIARRYCAHTLARLQNGDGGFYEADDFIQDLFLEFRRVAEAWHAEGSDEDDPLWAAWRRRLWHGGSRVLRRAPQRLWRRDEVSFVPGDLDGDTEDVGDATARFSRAIERALIQPEDAEATQLQADSLDDLAQALRAMPPEHRHVLQLIAVADEQPAYVAATLRLPNERRVYEQVRQARALLGRLRRW